MVGIDSNREEGNGRGRHMMRLGVGGWLGRRGASEASILNQANSIGGLGTNFVEVDGIRRSRACEGECRRGGRVRLDGSIAGKVRGR